MTIHDLRDGLRALSRVGALETVDRDVDQSWEVTAVLDRLEQERRYPAVLFRSIRGFSDWSIVGNVFATRAAISALLGTDPETLTDELSARLQKPVDPVIVEDGLVHEVVWTGDEASLDRIPLPTHHELDVAPYISLGVTICKDPDTGLRNVGIYRYMLRGPQELVPSLTSASNILEIFRRQESRGRPLEIAIVPGVNPLLSLAAAYKAPLGVDECALAGGLMGEAVQLVPAKTIDVEVPADAEVVIEARILPGERFPEAPFADMAGSYSRQKQGPLVEVSAITHRVDPILQLAFSGHPDTTNMVAVNHEVAIWEAIRKTSDSIRGVHVPASGYGLHCYIAVEKAPTVEGRERGEQRNAMLAAVGAVPQIKLVIAVDADVDIYDDAAIINVLARRFQAIDPLSGESRLMVLPNLKGAGYDASNFHLEYPSSKLLVDCTIRSDLTPEQLASFQDASCRGTDTIDLDAYLVEEPGALL